MKNPFNPKSGLAGGFIVGFLCMCIILVLPWPYWLIFAGSVIFWGCVFLWEPGVLDVLGAPVLRGLNFLLRKLILLIRWFKR